MLDERLHFAPESLACDALCVLGAGARIDAGDHAIEVPYRGGDRGGRLFEEERAGL